MVQWTIDELSVKRVPEFVQRQFETFAGNPLHEVAYPTHEAAENVHIQAIQTEVNSQSGTRALYLAAVSQESGSIVGGVICRYYEAEDSSSSSPHAGAIKNAAGSVTADDHYRQYVMNEVFRKRVSEIKGKHASEWT